MTLRETLGRRPRLGAGAAAVFVILGVAFILLQTRDRSTTSAGDTKSFFTVDDGKTWFVDDMTQIPPFQKDGKTAVRAFVYHGADGKPFVGYLQRFTPNAKRAIERIQAGDPNRKGPPDLSAIRMAYTVGREVKRPGDTQWVSSAQGLKSSKIIAVKDPNGTGDATVVEP